MQKEWLIVNNNISLKEGVRTMQNVELNLLPFIVEALGYNKTVYPDIDKLYQTKKSEFYQAARNHELYNHQIITEGGLLQEEYCKKALGILLCANSDEKIAEGILNIFRKGWTYAYLFVQNHVEIDLSKFMQRLIRKHGSLDKVSDYFINTNLFICLYLALCTEKKIVENDIYWKTLELLRFRLEHYKDDCPYRLSLKNSSPDLLEKVKKLKDEIYSKCGIIKDFNTLISVLGTKLEDIMFILDFEKLSILSITDNIKFSENDIDEILLAFTVTHETYTIDEAIQYLAFAIYIKYMSKAYKEVKQSYFKNNKETMYVELDILNNKINKLENEIARLTKLLSENEKALIALEKENERLKKECEVEKRNRQELNSLREFIFNLDKQEVYPESETIDYNVLKNYKAIVIGGHERWQSRMKKYLPEFIFIHPDNKNFDLKLLNDYKIDTVFVYVNYLNHAIYYRLMSAIQDRTIKIVYLNQQNEHAVLYEIWKVFTSSQTQS